nr:MAG TPA: hypothetical protein [Caudoviricetes sp.]
MPILKNKKASKHKCLLAFYVCVLIQRKYFITYDYPHNYCISLILG